MMQRVSVTTVALALVLSAVAHPAPAAQARRGALPLSATRPVVPAPGPTHRAMLDTYCVTCHNERNKGNAGRLALDSVDITAVAEHPEIWEKVIAKLRAGLMPPSGRPRPEAAQVAAFIGSLEGTLDQQGRANPNPGRTDAFHRLNRAEYRNAVRDLLSLELDVTAMLPADDASYGFDNIAGVLKISQSRLEQYLATARRVSRAAIGSPLPVPAMVEFRMPETTNQYLRADGLPFGTRGGMRIRHEFPREGEYEFRIELLCRLGGECDGSTGFMDTHHLEVLVDGERVKSFPLEPRKDPRPAGERTWKVRMPLRAGPHDIGVTFAKLPGIKEIDSAYDRFQRPYFLNGVIGQPHNTIYQPFLDMVTIVGPLGDTSTAGKTPSRARVFSCYPRTKAEEPVCAATILGRLARHAYRRPVTAEDTAPLVAVFKAGAAQGGFETGVEAALQRLLVSPEFLFRVERDPSGAAPNATYAISGLELASRLSFFLWSSIPDQTLIQLGATGQLRQPLVLEQQVRRMLKDPKSSALVDNFAGQWLMLRNLQAQRPDLPLFPNFDDSLREAARRETELLFNSILREEKSVIELLTADYTFVNERLARHYGIPKIYGAEFRKVSLPDSHRRGLLGHASILTVTSRPNRTSPVLRGKWILENILGTPAPDPPANVPPLQEEQDGNHGTVPTVRERIAKHRANPVCAGCHSMLDPPGFALENFDAVGQWRTRDESFTPIDASGSLPDGSKFDGLDTFRTMLLRNPDIFASTVTRKLMTYALGRGVDPADMPAIRRIVADARPQNLKLSALVVGVVRSVPFQMRRTAGAEK